MLFFLIGFMGSGKSFFGKKMATHMHFPFVDMDTAIQQKEGMPIAQIFEQKGEAYFRLQEHELLQSIIPQYGQQHAIVATGGGAPCYHGNMEIMNLAGTTIYFDLSANMLCQLLKNETHKRPLLKNLSEDELFEFVEKKLSERQSFYAKATIVVPEQKVNIEDLVQLIKQYV